MVFRRWCASSKVRVLRTTRGDNFEKEAQVPNLTQLRGVVLLALTVGFVLPSAHGQCTNNYDLSKLVPITFDRNNVVQGVYANTAKDKIVTTTSNCFVGPAGAGIFLGNSEQTTPSSCTFVLRRNNNPTIPSLVELPISCSAEGVWYDAIVVNDPRVVNSEGKQETWGFAKPKSGAVQSLSVASKSMKEQKTLAILNDGGITGGRVALTPLGDVDVFVRPQIGVAMLYLVISPAQLEKFAPLLSPADSKDLLRRMTTTFSK